MLQYLLNKKIQNGLSVNMTLTYNANVEHRVFQANQTNENGHIVNLPEWIIGINGFAVQTLNFENNFYMGEQGAEIGGTTPNLNGEETPFLIPGYHYSNNLMGNYLIGESKIKNRIEILMADGSKKELINSDYNFPSTERHWEPLRSDLGYAEVKLLSTGKRGVWYKPGDGLTYYFEEENVEYNNCNINDDNRRPAAMYLKRIESSCGAYLKLNYSYDPSFTTYGRKILDNIFYVPYKNSSNYYSVGSFSYTKTTDGHDVKTISLSLNNNGLTGDIFNKNIGSGAFSISKSNGADHTKVKYLSAITDNLGNENIINYSLTEHESREYKYGNNANSDNYFSFKHPLYLISNISYYNGRKTEFEYYDKAFGSNATYAAINFAEQFKENNDNMTHACRDNQTTYMLKKRKVYKTENSSLIPVWAEDYSYTFNGTNNRERPKTENIITTITKHNLTSETSSSPETETKLNFTKYYIQKYVDDIAGIAVKLKDKRIIKDAANFKEYSYNYDYGIITGYDYYTLGSFLKINSKEKTSIDDNFREDNTTFDYTFTGNNDFGIITNQKITYPGGLIKRIYYKEEFQDEPSGDENSYFNINAVEQFIIKGSDGLLKSKKIYEYYNDTEDEGEGKIKAVKKIDVTDNSRLQKTEFNYVTLNNVNKGFINKISTDNGLVTEYDYPIEVTGTDKVEYTPVECYTVMYDGAKTDNMDENVANSTWPSIPWLYDPFKIKKSFNGKILTEYLRIYNHLGVNYLIDENKFYHEYRLDNLDRISEVNLPGSWYCEPSCNNDPECCAALKSSEHTLIYNYDDINNTITTTSRFNCDPNNLSSLETKKEFDSFGNLIKRYNKNNSGNFELKEENKYNFVGLPYEKIDGMNVKKIFTYDFLNRISTEKYDGYPAKQYLYSPNADNDENELRQTTDEENKIFAKYYNVAGNLVKTQAGQYSPYTIFEYNSINQLTKVTSPEGKVITYIYDGFGNIKEKNTVDENKYQYKYDKWGNLRFTFHKASGDPWNITFNSYDALNRIDSIGIISMKQHPNWNFWEGDFGVDAAIDLVWDNLNPDTYNNFFDETENDESNAVAINMYDNYERTGVFTSLPSFSPEQIDDMNLKGRLVATAFRDKPGDTWNYKIFHYDYLGRIKKSQVKYGDNNWKDINNNYDHQGNLTKENIAGNYYIWNEYDLQGRLAKVKSYTADNYSAAKTDAIYNYNAADQITRLGTNNLNNLDIGKIDYSYNSVGRLKSIASYYYATPQQELERRFFEDLTYYENGNVKTQTIENRNLGSSNNLNFNYDYDAMNRLINSNCNVSNNSESYTYDFDGNFTTKTLYTAQNPVVLNYEYYANSNKLKEIWFDSGIPILGHSYHQPLNSFQYDQKGNLTFKSNDVHLVIPHYFKEYDYRNLLLEYSDNNSGTVKYKYDDQGNRISKVGNGLNEFYLRDHTGREVAIYKNGGTTLQSINLYGNGLIGYIDKTANKRYYYVKDHLGSIRQVIHKTADYGDDGVVAAKNYQPYGSIIKGYNNATDYRYDFTGKQLDTETNFRYFGARYYDDIGRWTTVDPLASKYPGWSPYNYSFNNPLKYVDSDGRAPGLPIVVGVAEASALFFSLAAATAISLNANETAYALQSIATSINSNILDPIYQGFQPAPTSFFPSVQGTGITQTVFVPSDATGISSTTSINLEQGVPNMQNLESSRFPTKKEWADILNIPIKKVHDKLGEIKGSYDGNPDIGIENGNIILKPRKGALKGKEIKTEDKIKDYL